MKFCTAGNGAAAIMENRMTTEWADSIALSVSEYALGANGDLSQDKMIRAVADGPLVDWCYEYLFDGYGVDLNKKAMAAVRRLVATAMFRQQAFETDHWGRVMARAANARSRNFGLSKEGEG
jgi:hypothetical protein